MAKYQGYEKYKDSEVEWLGKIPAHWKAKKLKFVATVQPSNVDKKTLDDEDPVLLCNYLDVYNNEWITDEIEFMKATATQAEINKFSITKGDVIITKDSESSNDIAVPALVVQDFENVVCGYHLTQIKQKDLNGSFVFRLFQCTKFNAQFVVSANGVTRFGLPQRAVNDAFVGVPPIDEQESIARFLDRKTSQIDALIAKKTALLEKLDEKRTALISHAVTKGLDRNVPMKDSGVEWLGDIPEHWEVTRIKRVFVLQRGVDIRQEDQTIGTVPVVSSGGIASYHNVAYSKSPGVLVGRKGTLGTVYYIDVDYWPHDTTLWIIEFYNNNPRFIYYKLLSMKLENWDTGSANPTLNRNLIHPLATSWTSSKEQEKIAEYLDQKTAEIDRQKAKVKEAIELLKEYRTALITNAVTGKIDVRQVGRV